MISLKFKRIEKKCFSFLTLFHKVFFVQMIRFLVGAASGWTAARTINPNVDTPWKPPTYEECIILGQKLKKTIDDISKKLEVSKENSENN